MRASMPFSPVMAEFSAKFPKRLLIEVCVYYTRGLCDTVGVATRGGLIATFLLRRSFIYAYTAYLQLQ